MKHTLIALALLTTLSAHATSYGQGGDALTQSQFQQQQSNSTGGNASVNQSSDNPLQFPIIPSAIAPSQSVNAICQIATPQSSAFTFMFIVSESGTKGVVYNDVCYAYLRGQYDVADKLMCLKSADYAKVNAVVCK